MSHELNQRFPLVLAGTPRFNTAGNPNLSSAPGYNGGFLIASNQNIMQLNQVTSSPTTTYGPGTFGFYNPRNWQSVNTASLSSLECCPLVLVGASPYTKDSPGGFHQGWQIPIKSKPIDPRNIHHFYRVEPCTPQPGVYHFGQTPKTIPSTSSTVAGDIVDLEIISVVCNGTGAISTNCSSPSTVTGLTIVSSANPSATLGTLGIQVCQNTVTNAYTIIASNLTTTANFTVGDVITGTVGTAPNDCVIQFRVQSVSSVNNCCYNFVCNETYNFYFDVKGTPVYQAYFKNTVRHITIKTPCCDPNNPNNIYVNPVWVYLELAKAVIADPELSKFIFPIVWDGTNYYYPPQSAYPHVTYPAPPFLTYADLSNTLTGNLLDNDPFCGTSTVAGIIFQTAYIETRFGNCTFQVSDGYTYDIIRLNAQLVDWNGDPCFESICFYTECEGHPGQGSGEDALRDLIRMQHFQAHNMPENLRYREVLLENDVIALINRNQRYYRYQFLFEHKPYTEFAAHPIDTNPYRVEILTTNPDPAFETFMNSWLGYCSPCPGMEVIGCQRCDFDLINPTNNQPVILQATNA